MAGASGIRSSSRLALCAAKALFSCGVAVEAFGGSLSDDRPLLQAAYDGDLKVVRRQLAAGADVNASNSKGHTALMCAASRGHDDTVDLLLATRGIDAFRQDAYGLTALSHAARHNRLASASSLLAYEKGYNKPLGSDKKRYFYKLVDRDNRSPLAYAVEEGYFEMARLLVKGGFPVDLAGYGGQSSLALAATHGDIQTVDTLLALGANANLKNAKGVTPLMQAAAANRLEAAGVLLNRGAKADLTDNLGRDALIYAAWGGFPLMISRGRSK